MVPAIVFHSLPCLPHGTGLKDLFNWDNYITVSNDMQEKTQHFSKKFKNMTFRPNNVRFLLRNSPISASDIFNPIEHIASQEVSDKDDHHPFSNKGPAVFINIDKRNRQRDYLCTWNWPLQDQPIEKGKEHVS